MKLYDADSIINGKKPLKEGDSKDTFKFLDRWKLGTGTFVGKLLRHPERCPDGYKLHTTHMWEEKVGQSWKDQRKCLCSESINGLREAIGENDKGDQKKFLLPIKPCAPCDFVESVRLTKARDGSPWFDTLDDDYQKIIDEISVVKQRAWLFPILLYCTEQDAGVTGTGAAKTRFEPDPKVLGSFLLKLRPSRDSGDGNLYRSICKFVAANGDQVFAKDGLWFRYDKQATSQELEPANSRRLTVEEERHFRAFPDIMSFGKGVTTGNFQRPSQIMSWERAKAFLENSWWGKKLGKLGYDWDALEEGLAGQLPPGFKEVDGAADEADAGAQFDWSDEEDGEAPV